MRKLILLALTLLLASSAFSETVYFGTKTNLGNGESVNLVDNIVYAIDVGGDGVTYNGVGFDRDKMNTDNVNNGSGSVGSVASPDTAGYYPNLNSIGNTDNPNTTSSELNTLMSTCRGDSGTPRLIQFDVVPDVTYRVQILFRNSNSEDRRFDLSVGFGSDADKVDDNAIKAWSNANFAADNLQESTPGVWSGTLTATSDRLWIHAVSANYLGLSTAYDPNPNINAIIISEAPKVNFGIVTEIADDGSNVDVEDTIVYAIDVGGDGATFNGVDFDADNADQTSEGNNGTGVGTNVSPYTPGYYPNLNSENHSGTSFSTNSGLNDLMSYHRNDSGTPRVIQFDVTSGATYRVQVLYKSSGTEDRKFDLSVGFGSDADKVDDNAIKAWSLDNLAADNLQESTPSMWSGTLVATSDRLWIHAANANYLGSTTDGDPNPNINAIIIRQIPQELVYFGILQDLTGGANVDTTTGKIAYAIDLGGQGVEFNGVDFDPDNIASESNDSSIGVKVSSYTDGYYPNLNGISPTDNPNTTSPELNTLMSTCRGDSGTPRVIQFDVIPGEDYLVQILCKSSGTEDRRFDLSVGFGTDPNKVDDNAIKEWSLDNLAADNLQESTPSIWSAELTATSDKLWIHAANANYLGDTTDVDPNPNINAIIISRLTAGNLPPLVDAGVDQTLELVGGTYSHELLGQVYDPEGQEMSTTWTSSDETNVTFDDATSPNVTATFHASGTYTLTLTVDDGVHERSDSVVFQIHDFEEFYIGTVEELTFGDNVNLGGNILYAIDVGGDGATFNGVTFDADNADQISDGNNGTGVGTNVSPYTAGYYPNLNGENHNGTSFSANSGLNDLMSYNRNDSVPPRVIQFDVTPDMTYLVQILYKSSESEDRRFDLSVGFGTDADKIDDAAIAAWSLANLVADNLQESTPSLWYDTFTATSDKLWIHAATANYLGLLAGTGTDPNPNINAIVITEIAQEALHFGTVGNLSDGSNVDITTGQIVYAIDVGGNGASFNGVAFDADDIASESNGGNVGVKMSSNTSGYYPNLNSTGSDATTFPTDFSSNGGLNDLMSCWRNDSSQPRIIQFDVTPGENYLVQILYKSTTTEERRFDLSVGFGTDPNKVDDNAIEVWSNANFAADNLQESSPGIWSAELTATSYHLWIHAATANYLGAPILSDPNPNINAIIISRTTANNLRPAVDTGADQILELDHEKTIDYQLAASASDPEGLAISAIWTFSGDPNLVTFDDVTDPNATATFHAAGTYVLDLTADDGVHYGFDRVVVDVHDFKLHHGAAKFLKKTVGSAVDMTLSSKKKNDMQVFWEELLIQYPRENAKGKWVDDIPDIQPVKLDIAPQLADEVLYYDSDQVEMHWDAFCQRNPDTANYLVNRISLPVVITDMPRSDIAGFIKRKKREVRTVNVGSEEYFQRLAKSLLYADFLIARGDDLAKESVFKLLRDMMFWLPGNIDVVDQDKSLLKHVSMELLWPVMDVDKGRYDELAGALMNVGIRSKYRKDGVYAHLNQPDYIRAVKWTANHASVKANKRHLMFGYMGNSYSTQTDYLGILLSRHAGHFNEGYDANGLNHMSNMFRKLCGEVKGQAMFRKYLEELLKVIEDPEMESLLLSYM